MNFSIVGKWGIILKYVDVDKILNDPLFHAWKKKDLVQALKDAEPVSLGCFCEECVHRNTSACPAYDAPMRRTSLRVHFCSEGEPS